MTYQVRIGKEAKDQIAQAFWFIHTERHRPMNAERWLQGLYDAIDPLETTPQRCPLAREHGLIEDVELRQLVHKSHRLIFTIRGPKVHVLELRHTARMSMTAEELDELLSGDETA